MTKSEALDNINGTIEQIREYCRHVDDGMDASYVANSIESWLDQLRNDIRDYDDAEDEEVDE
jgi:hypothetical protein